MDKRNAEVKCQFCIPGGRSEPAKGRLEHAGRFLFVAFLRDPNEFVVTGVFLFFIF